MVYIEHVVVEDGCSDFGCICSLIHEALYSCTDSVIKTSVPAAGTQVSRGMRFPTMWHFDFCKFRRASAASF